VWIRGHGFEKMQKSVRSTALELHENIAAIEAWRTTLTEKQRRRRIHPLSNVAAWRKATQHKNKYADDTQRAAAIAWRRFVSCVEALPPDQAAPLWQAVHAQAAIQL
jgi:DNA-directed RNA polymerase specialized sigma24 family protein